MKIERNWVYWSLVNASYKGYEVCFALTNNKKAEPIFELTSEINKDWKIILMPIQENAKTPSKEEFQKMEEYFFNEGYFEFLELWWNWLNNYPKRFKNGKALEAQLLFAKSKINKIWKSCEEFDEYTDDDEG